MYHNTQNSKNCNILKLYSKSPSIGYAYAKNYENTENKPAEAVRKTASVDSGNLYVRQKMQKNLFLRIEPLIAGGMLTKIGQKLFTH